MITIYSEDHKLRDAKTELAGGELVAPFEKPARMEFIIDRIQATQLGEIRAPRDFGLEPLTQVHDPDYVEFLAEAWSLWQEAGYQGEAMTTCWPARRMVQRKPTHIDGLLGYYSLAVETSITSGTYQAALASANVALNGAELLNQGELKAFSLCRPPGHHAALDMFGGYCFFNNAGLGAQHLLNQGAGRIAIFDVDYHHGNGTQDIFYQRDDVLFISIHAHPAQEFPHFLGYADENGEAEGEGFNINYPLYHGANFEQWLQPFKEALDQIRNYSPDALIVSLGVDTFENDPISHFKLQSDDFITYGSYLADLNLPTLFVMEGGYAVEEIGINTVNVLQGFEGTA